ncbi:MAG: hypothetical protein M3471_08820 [Actinomycetota bacterium]|nr:hypothetical protein [Actinomycetota bacterium]
MAESNVVLYELNEVPWEIVDHYIKVRPGSHLAQVLSAGRSMTTVDDDPVPLQPWRTWPTLHSSMYTEDHNSFDLGQDPVTFRGAPLWDVAEAAGLAVGLVGPLQSWPPRPFAHGGFFVPDTFSRTPDTHPAGLRRFQRFNLAMTRENSFSSDVRPDVRQMAAVGLDLLRLGLMPSSVATLAGQLVGELRDPRYKGRRPAMQVLPTFDLFWRLHQRHQPRLSIFFTNHVAAMMHRYWGDWVPEYAEREGYPVDEVFAGFVVTAMDLFDRHLGRILGHMAANPATVLIVAASMGQGPIPYHHLDRTFVLEQPDRLLRELALPEAEAGLAMYPRVSLKFDDEQAAEGSLAALGSVVGADSRAMFRDLTVHGHTVSFEIDHDHPQPDEEEQLNLVSLGGSPKRARPGDIGVAVRKRLGGGNTAYHVPEGMLLAYGAGIGADASRARVSVLDVAPSILADLLGIEPAPSMKGVPGLFRAEATV